MLFSLFLSLGNYNPLYILVFKYVPFFNGIRYPVKFLSLIFVLPFRYSRFGVPEIVRIFKRW